jgi:RNA polymerase sigma-70 factor (ECF subfamily)
MSSETPTSTPPRPWRREDIADLLRRYAPRLERFAARRFPADLLRRESPADIVQAVFVDVLRDFDSFDDHGAGEVAFRQWVFRSLLRKLYDRRKFHRRERRDLAREVAPAPDQHLVSETPSRKVVASETGALVHQALATLPAPYIEIIRLVQIEGLSAAEAGLRLGISTVAARSLMARALRQLAIAFRRAAGGPSTTYVVRRRRGR